MQSSPNAIAFAQPIHAPRNHFVVHDDLEPVQERARALLGRSELLRLVASSQHQVVVERVALFLASTSLVTGCVLEALTALDADASRRISGALCDVLYGDVHMPTAVQVWIDALSMAGLVVSWQLATLPLALVQPAKHRYVQVATSEPSGETYVRMLRLYSLSSR